VPFGWRDGFDVVAVAAVFWLIIVWLRRARGRLALLGVGIAGAVYLLAQVAGLELTAWIFQGFFAVLVVILVVVFQEDLRRLFERIAVWGLRRRSVQPPTTVADLLVRTVAHLASTRTGALIVIPGVEPLERHVEGGIALDAIASEPLLLSLFDAGSPGHDGAVLLVANRIERFALHLPLSTNQEELGPGGTRHAAALGLSERCDAICIVISEERGTVSIARDGVLRVLRQPQELIGELGSVVAKPAPPHAGASRFLRSVRGHWREGLLAIALAATLWAARVPGSTIAEVVRVAPIVIHNLPADFEIESVDPATVQVTLRGLRRDLLLQSREKLEVRIDALLAKLGRRTFRISPEQVSAPDGVEILSIEPSQVRISLNPTDPGTSDPSP
jgi:uncharacterized protein (TIGR00159 family)